MMTQELRDAPNAHGYSDTRAYEGTRQPHFQSSNDRGYHQRPDCRDNRGDQTYRSRASDEAFSSPQSFGQENMAVRRYIGSKTFDGENVNAKVFSLEELIDTVRMIQQSGASDHVVLRNIGMSLSGEARTWWSANRTFIQSVQQWEQAIRDRFDQRQSSKEALMTSVYSRKQKEGERLARYVDEVNVMMDRLPQMFSESHRLAILVENANDSCKPLLRLRGARTMLELVSYANTFVEAKAAPKPNTTKLPRFIKKVNALATNTDDERSEAPEIEEHGEDEVEIDIQALIKQLMKTERSAKGNKQRVNVPRESKPSAAASQNRPTNVTTVAIKGEEPLICANCLNWGHRFDNCSEKPNRKLCFGCGRPDTYRNECPTCTKKSKNELTCLNATACQTPASKN